MYMNLFTSTFFKMFISRNYLVLAIAVVVLASIIFDGVVDKCKEHKLLFSVDSNSRSDTWFDAFLIDVKRQELNENLSPRNLLILNQEDAEVANFQSGKGDSKTDLTFEPNWSVSMEVSLLDHYIVFDNTQKSNNSLYSILNYNLFENQLKLNKNGANEMLSINTVFFMTEKTITCKDLDLFVAKLQKAFIKTFSSSFSQYREKKLLDGRSVSWWNNQLSPLRKLDNAKRRKYERTYINRELGEERKSDYYRCNFLKSKFWREYCNFTDRMPPLNFIYKLAGSNMKSSEMLTTSDKENGEMTNNLQETLKLIIGYFVADDDEKDEEFLIPMKSSADNPLSTPRDVPLTIDEILIVLEGIDSKKTPGIDGFSSAIFLHLSKMDGINILGCSGGF